METREEMFHRIKQEESGKLIPIDRNAPPSLIEDAKKVLFEAVCKFPLNHADAVPAVRRLAKKISRAKSKDFFLDILDDESEKLLWMFFITGCVPKIDTEGNVTIVAASADPIQFQAFRQAVAYKRGQPPVKVEAGEDGKTAILAVVPVEYIGANPEFFAEQAKTAGLIK